MTGNKDPMGSISEEIELLERHISILKTVRANQPIGLIRLSEMTDIPKHRVRYSLKLLEQQGIIIPTTGGATVSDKCDLFLKEIADHVEIIEAQIRELKKKL